MLRIEGADARLSAVHSLRVDAAYVIALGTGIYMPREAAALLHEDAATVRRWAFGYTRVRPAGRVHHAPLIRTELPEMEGERALTFVELVELLYIRAFNRAGASWKTIREAAGVAARLYAAEHPFALRQLYLDPDGFLYGAMREADDSEAFVQLRGHGQHAFPQLIRPYLEQLEFDAHDLASRWRPLGAGGGVMVDPAHAFGAPVVEEVGIRTATLADTFRAELPRHGDRAAERVAWMFEIERRHVETALGFERWLRKAA